MEQCHWASNETCRMCKVIKCPNEVLHIEGKAKQVFGQIDTLAKLHPDMTLEELHDRLN